MVQVALVVSAGLVAQLVEQVAQVVRVRGMQDDQAATSAPHTSLPAGAAVRVRTTTTTTFTMLTVPPRRDHDCCGTTSASASANYEGKDDDNHH